MSVNNSTEGGADGSHDHQIMAILAHMQQARKPSPSPPPGGGVGLGAINVGNTSGTNLGGRTRRTVNYTDADFTGGEDDGLDHEVKYTDDGFLEGLGNVKLATSQALPAQHRMTAEEWTRSRKDNHKEVERRRRETINENINRLKDLVPGCEKNKGLILMRTVEYIQELKNELAANIEKWTLESILLSESMNELKTENERLRSDTEEIAKLRVENEQLRSRLQLGEEPNADNKRPRIE